jgi:hypothetical protein
MFSRIFIFIISNIIVIYNDTDKKIAAVEGSTPKGTTRAPIDLGADGFKQDDFGIAGGLVQTHLQSVLRCCLSADARVHTTAAEVIYLALEQGLVHPLICMPTILAMQAIPGTPVAIKALTIHQKLAEKHASFIHGRNMDGLRLMYVTRQTRLQQLPVDARLRMPPASACLAPLFGILRLKRLLKYESLLAILELFHDASLVRDVANGHGTDGGSSSSNSSGLPSPQTPATQRDPNGPKHVVVSSSEPQPISPKTPGMLGNIGPEHQGPGHGTADAGFAAFLVENLLAFPYKYQEEVSFVMNHALRILGSCGVLMRQLLEGGTHEGWQTMTVRFPGLHDAVAKQSMLLLLVQQLRACFPSSHHQHSVQMPLDGSARTSPSGDGRAGSPVGGGRDTLLWPRDMKADRANLHKVVVPLTGAELLNKVGMGIETASVPAAMQIFLALMDELDRGSGAAVGDTPAGKGANGRKRPAPSKSRKSLSSAGEAAADRASIPPEVLALAAKPRSKRARKSISYEESSDSEDTLTSNKPRVKSVP